MEELLHSSIREGTSGNRRIPAGLSLLKYSDFSVEEIGDDVVQSHTSRTLTANNLADSITETLQHLRWPLSNHSNEAP